MCLRDSALHQTLRLHLVSKQCLFILSPDNLLIIMLEYRRNGLLAGSLRQLEVRAWKAAPPTGLSPTTGSTLCGARSSAVPAGGSFSAVCAGAGAQARYVTLQIKASTSETLAPCEVSVYGPGERFCLPGTK